MGVILVVEGKVTWILHSSSCGIAKNGQPESLSVELWKIRVDDWAF
jgi:hypothetical protein